MGGTRREHDRSRNRLLRPDGSRVVDTIRDRLRRVVGNRIPDGLKELLIFDVNEVRELQF
jgi:hypothetical protein